MLKMRRLCLNFGQWAYVIYKAITYSRHRKIWFTKTPINHATSVFIVTKRAINESPFLLRIKSFPFLQHLLHQSYASRNISRPLFLLPVHHMYTLRLTLLSLICSHFRHIRLLYVHKMRQSRRDASASTCLFLFLSLTHNLLAN